jgi:hypothetical protein
VGGWEKFQKQTKKKKKKLGGGWGKNKFHKKMKSGNFFGKGAGRK